MIISIPISSDNFEGGKKSVFGSW